MGDSGSDNVRGVRRLEVGGVPYTIQFTINACCAVEQELGINIEDLAAQESTSITQLRALLWAGLLEHHPDLTVLEAGKVLTVLANDGGAIKATRLIFESLQEAFPRPEDETAPAIPRAPANRGRGGRRSTNRRSSSA